MLMNILHLLHNFLKILNYFIFQLFLQNQIDNFNNNINYQFKNNIHNFIQLILNHSFIYIKQLVNLNKIFYR